MHGINIMQTDGGGFITAVGGLNSSDSPSAMGGYSRKSPGLSHFNRNRQQKNKPSDNELQSKFKPSNVQAYCEQKINEDKIKSLQFISMENPLPKTKGKAPLNSNSDIIFQFINKPHAAKEQN